MTKEPVPNEPLEPIPRTVLYETVPSCDSNFTVPEKLLFAVGRFRVPPARGPAANKDRAGPGDLTGNGVDGIVLSDAQRDAGFDCNGATQYDRGLVGYGCRIPERTIAPRLKVDVATNRNTWGR